MATDLKAVIAKNVRALLGKPAGSRGATSALLALGFSNGDATRILAGKTSFGVDKLADLAVALKVDPWVLCVPNLDPERLPSLEAQSFRWPFRSIDPDVVTGLVGTTAQAVERGLLVSLETAGISPRKQHRAA